RAMISGPIACPRAVNPPKDVPRRRRRLMTVSSSRTRTSRSKGIKSCQLPVKMATTGNWQPTTDNSFSSEAIMATVKLLLKESIKNVGRVGDVVEVSPGYARNFLLPKDLAVEPTPNNVKKIEARRKEVERLEA